MMPATSLQQNACFRRARSAQAHLVALTRPLLHQAIRLERNRTTVDLTNLRGIKLAPESSVAFVRDGQVLGAGGLAEYDEHLQAWMLVSKFATRREIVQGVRLARQWLDIKSKTAPRIYIYVRALAPWCDSFTAALGFKDTGDIGLWGSFGEPLRRYVREGVR